MSVSEGQLAGHGIAELFAGLASQRRTGIIEVTGLSPGPDLQVGVLSGRVVRIGYAGRPADLFGQRLLAAGAVDARQLRAALKVQKASPETPIGEVLVTQGSLEREVRDQLLRLQVRERLGALFEAEAGRFKFHPRPPNFTRPAFDPVSAEAVLADGLRRAEEWPLIRTKVAGDGAVFRVVSAPPVEEDEAAALARALDEAYSEVVDEEGGVGPDGKRRLSRAERRVLELVDGKRNVAAIIRLSRLGAFDTCKALYNLAHAGHLSLVRAGRVGAVGGAGQGAQLARRVALNLLVLSGLAAACWGLWQAREEAADNRAVLGHTVAARLRANRIDALATALEIHRLTHGEYPATLQALVDGGLVAPFVLEPLDGQPWDYVGVGLDYDLR